MGCRRWVFGWLGVLAGWVAGGAAPAQTPPGPTVPGRAAPLAFAPARIPLEDLPDGVRERVRAVVEQPTLSAHGPVEAFRCRPATYSWLLDHPDQAARLWQLLGARCAEIEDRGGGRFGWRDASGSDIQWETVLRGPRQRVWYAEGRARPGLLLPAVPVRAVVLLEHAEGKDRAGHPAVRHQMHLILHADSRGVALATRLLGATAPRLAEQYVGQLQMFFGALAWYLDQRPSEK
jgi:hypothetical protein